MEICVGLQIGMLQHVWLSMPNMSNLILPCCTLSGFIAAQIYIFSEKKKKKYEL